MSTLPAVVQSNQPGALVSLFKLDATSIGGSVYYFCQGARTAAEVTFGGQLYIPVDVEFTNFAMNGAGALPQPHMKVGNSNGVFQGIVNTYGDMLGCLVQRIRTFSQFLDDGTSPDPTAYYGPDTFRVARKVSENPVFIEWELAADIDQQGKLLPGRQVLRDNCLWRYRFWDTSLTPAAFNYTKAQCPYTGAGMYDIKGVTVTDPTKDVCSRNLSGCKLRFGAGNPLPFGGFPGVARVKGGA